MSMYGSQQRGLNMMGRRTGSRSEINAAPAYPYARSEVVVQRGNNGFTQEYVEGFNQTFSRGSMSAGQVPAMPSMQQQISNLQVQCQEYLDKTAFIINSGGDPSAFMEAQSCLASAAEINEQLRLMASDLRQQNVPSDRVIRSVNLFSEQIRELDAVMAGVQQQSWSSRTVRRTVSREEPNRYYSDAMAWILQQRRLIETALWGDDLPAIEQQIANHRAFHSSIQRSEEVDRARTELMRLKDQNTDGNKSFLNKLEQEWDGLQKSSYQRSVQLQDLHNIIEEISGQIMWVNDREEEELVFDWGDKNIDGYLPQKHEAFSKLMSDLEQKEVQLNVLKTKVDSQMKNKHPASDKIQAYMETLQTQWSWLLQITKCIGVHLKENAQYSQFYKETCEMNAKLMKERDGLCKNFSCDKTTALHKLLDLQQGLERERERLTEQRAMVQQLVLKSKSIIRLKPRNPEEKITGRILVQALCDFRQDEKTIRKGDEGILKDNSERTTWLVTGPGGMDMQIPSVCLLVPPPNPLAINLANKNSQIYEAILTVWNQLYINVKSLISWQYCLLDISRVNSLTISMLAKMGPEETNNIIRSLEMHFQEFKKHSQGSELFGAEDHQLIENQLSGAQQHYGKLTVELPAYVAGGEGSEFSTAVSVRLLNELNALRFNVERAESSLVTFLYIPLGEDGPEECSRHIASTQVFQKDVQTLKGEFVSLRESVEAELKDAKDTDKARYLRGQLEVISQSLANLENYTAAHLQRLSLVKALLKDLLKAEDVVKVYEARLIEKETVSLDPEEIQKYQKVLQSMHSDLEQKHDVLHSLVSDLSKVQQCNDQTDQGRYRCVINISQYAEHVSQLSDRWKRILLHITSRYDDLDSFLPQLQRYLQDSSRLSGWIDETQRQINAQQSIKTDDITVYDQLVNQQKALNADIKAKRELLETVQNNGDACINAIKNYELELASYGAGLETMLNIPIKRTVLNSPSKVITEEVSSLNAHYLELLTRSSDHHKLLTAAQKNMQDLNMMNTEIGMRNEEIQQLKDVILNHTAMNASLQEALLKYKQELDESQRHLLSLEEVKRNETWKCMTTQDSLDSSTNRLQELTEEVRRLKQQLEDMERKKKVVEERYTFLQEEYDQTMRKKVKELETANWTMKDLEKTVSERTRELERLRKELDDEARRFKEAQTELAKTSSVIQTSQSQCSHLQQERDGLLEKTTAMEQEITRLKKLEDELERIKLSLESEIRLKSQMQEDNERIKKDFTQWKSKCAIHEEQLRQHISERSGLEGQFNSVNTEMERLRTHLKEAEERYRLLLQNLEQERAQMQALRDSQQKELQKLREKSEGAAKYTQTDQTDDSSLVFEGVRKKVTAQQLRDCGVIDKVTFEQLINGQRTVQDVSVDIRLNLKGTGAIAGLETGPKGKMTFTEAKKQKLISDESGNMLLEAQAATGYIIDPRANVKMTVEEACLNGLVDEADKNQLLIAEAACVGFRDPKTAKLLPASQAMKKGLIDRETALRLLQAQEAAGGILDPILSVYLSKDTAMDRDLVDEDLYQALNARPDCYIDPDTDLHASYVTLKKRCKADLNTGLLLLPAPEKPLTVPGLRSEVNVSNLVDAKLLEPSDVDQLREGKITIQDIEHRLRAYLRGSTCIAGIYDEANDCTLPIYQAMKNGLLRPGTTLELLEAQAASGFMIDPIHNEYYTVEEACKKGLVGVEFKDKLLSAERAVTGYKDPATEKMISLFEAIERGLIEKGHGIRLLEAQIASGGIIDPKHSHRLDVDVAYQKGYFDEEMNQILKDEGDDTKGFFDPNTEDNLTYLQLKSRCIADKKTGLVLLPLYDKKKIQQKNSSRKRRVLIVDPESNKEMTVREAYEKKLIDYETFLELCQQECEWEETVITAADGSTSTAIMDMQTGIQYDLQELLAKGVISQDVLDKYRSGIVTLTEFADMITQKTKTLSKPLSSSVISSSSSSSSQMTMKSQTIKTETVKKVESTSTAQDPFSTNSSKHISSMSVKLTPLVEIIEEQSPVGAIFDTEKLEKISVCDAMKRGIIDSITGQRLLEAQACTGGIVNPETGRRMSIQEATRVGVLDEDMANRVKPAQKAYIGFEDVKTKRKMSAAEAVKEKWLPYEAGQRFLEFQYLTGGLFDPELGSRRSLEEALQLGWLDMRSAQRLQDSRHHPKTLTCPKTKLRISYKEALEACMNEEKTDVRMLPAATVSSRGISSPYNLSNPGSASGSRSGSRRGSVDYSLSPSSSTKYSSFSYSRTSFSSRSLS
ncbi:desmoplakin isoform X2 [Pimephales promelas]|uniref:desmoplakin isoform X2 n=1 Tax=Pimephales promelas TaxID=90988 RepID=UPI0019558A81|nr:desmoplakin isoform X2 [Pimephales promelas]KAG1941839.1 desmoplakin [Pimephales promelas]